MTEPRHLDLIDRLRGQYHLPVNDGAGPLNGSMTFSREFPTPPIQKEAAVEIEKLRAALSATVGQMMNAQIDLSTGKTKAAVANALGVAIKAAEGALTQDKRADV
jgi:hypothetical protein